MRFARRTLALLALTPAALLAQRLTYPVTRTVDQTDTFFGSAVADPYRWLENENAADVARWVEAQNKVTFAYLEQIPYRVSLKARLTQLFNYARFSSPARRGETYFFSKNDGLQNQSVYYTQRGLDGTPELLLDPNTFSKDGTSRLAGFAPSRDGKYVAYGVSIGGSDWTEYRVMETATRRTLPDAIMWAKVSGIAWQGDGFYYSRYDVKDSATALTQKNEAHKVYYHAVGTPQSQDVLQYDDPANPQRFHIVSTTDDEQWAVLSISDRGKGKKGNALLVRARGAKAWTPLIADVADDDYDVVDALGGQFLVKTNHGAPNSRVVRIDPKNPGESKWETVLAERPEPLDAVSSAGGKLFAEYSKDVTTRVSVYDLTGKFEREIAMPGLGTAGGFGGRSDDKTVFYSYTSFDTPSSIYRYDIASGTSTLFRAPTIPGFRAADYETKQVFFTSKDGTRVPMFLTHKRGLPLDGHNPVVLYGYGGFNAAVTPSFSALRLALLEQGVVYASANIRGGSEYGERWHQAGARLNKQNVFDDFIGAAEWLIANKYTEPSRLAIHGVSNGGLLVGAVANQRPELFGAVIQQAGVMDMLRFHKFTIGWNWIADYGSPDDSAEFKVLRAYSPIHNVRAGATYPSTLITTADHDDRVVPAHSFKYAAAMQAAQSGDAPILIRIDTKSGHGASSTTKQIEQTADLYAFVFKALGVSPKVIQ